MGTIVLIGSTSPVSLYHPPPHLSEKMLGTAIYRLYNIVTFPLTNKNLFPPNVIFFDKDQSYIDPSDHIANSRSFLNIILKVGLLTFFSQKVNYICMRAHIDVSEF